MKKPSYSKFLSMESSTAPGQTWKNDIEHSRIEFRTTHMSISDVSGIFSRFDVNLQSDQSDFSDSEISLTAHINSLNTEVAARDNHLKSPDFFDSDNCPILEFHSTKVRKTAVNNYEITGDLSCHNITKKVKAKMKYRGTVFNPKTDKVTAGFHVMGKINRSDFNIGPKFSEDLISDEVNFFIDTELQKQ